MKILVAALIMLTLTIGGNAMIETVTTTQLARGADLVVLADVVGVKSLGLKEKNLEVIANLVKVNEPLKGNAAVGEDLKIKTWRGIEDSVILKEGTRVLLFLKKIDNHFTIFNGPQGCWQVDKDGQFTGMGKDITMDQGKEAIATPAPASSTYAPVMF